MEFKTFESIDKWVEKHLETCRTRATAGEQFEYRFFPTGIGYIQTVKCCCCGAKFEDDDIGF